MVAQVPASTASRQRHASQVRRLLKKHYPDAACALEYDSPFQLLIATILSAQCTDKRVNQVTRPLFDQYPTAQELAKLSVRRLEIMVQSTGFFRNKARNIQACCRMLNSHYGGQVPQTLEQLTQLAGVGRKTANVVLGTAFGIPSGVVVDTHVGRLSRRLGLTSEKDPIKVETDLMSVLPRKEWIAFSHRMIHHGRSFCQARKPQCESCPLLSICPRITLTSTLLSKTH
ncbi:MAG: endonuclease III [Planctomycetota bacterium]|nr:endonuclease III [Planctomycetota bacterium]